jgi:putative glutamine amidotransferase
MPTLIGITAGRIKDSSAIIRVALIDKYISAIQNAGGIPLILPSGTRAQELGLLFEKFDGFLLTGGGDIATERFGGEPNPKVYDIDPDRDELEIGLALMASKMNKPLLGICRGHQVINVALGGTLYTDITSQRPNALRHDWFPDIPRDYEAHSIKVSHGSLLENILSTNELQVNSLHHQGIKQLAADLTPTAFAPDGIIEAVEVIEHRFFMGVQWHPEWMLARDDMTNLFRTFVSTTNDGKQLEK